MTPRRKWLAGWLLATGPWLLASGLAGAGDWFPRWHATQSDGDDGGCSSCKGAHGQHCPNLHIDNCASIPGAAQPAPPGFYINNYIRVQETKAELDDFVIYKHMWYRGGTELGPLGRYQLDMITARIASAPFPVVIETSKNDRLDEQRRDVIVAMLKMRGLDDPTRVLVAFPIAGGLYGDEANRIYQGLINGGFGFGGGLFGNPAAFGFGGFGFR
jgi:hypothetical protein